MQLKNIVEDADSNQWECHRCYQEDDLFIGWGFKYTLTTDLPVGWTPSLLIEVILEACVYSAFSNRGDISVFVRDACLLQEKVKPELDFFASTEFYFRHTVYNLKYVPRIARFGPYVRSEEEVSIAHRHNLFQRLALLVHECHNKSNNEYELMFTLTKTSQQSGVDRDKSIEHEEKDKDKTRGTDLEFLDDGEIPIPPIVNKSDTCSN